jgi:signal transduction histidine kinase
MSVVDKESEKIVSLRDKIESLDQANERLHSELRQVNQKLKESEALKDHFVSNISNEIINPFASIIGLSQNIILSKKEDWKRVITMTAMIHGEAFNLDFQLRNIFMVAKLEAGDVMPEISNVKISTLVDSVIGNFAPIAKKRNIQILHETQLLDSSGIASAFPTDPEKLRLILSNLLSNAIQYSSESDRIELNSKIENDDLVISVKDYGKGISEANQKIIYDRFKRLDSGINSLNRGHGLGLSVNKALIDILCGNIEIESKRNEGANFTISLPILNVEKATTAMDEDELLFDSFETEISI